MNCCEMHTEWLSIACEMKDAKVWADSQMYSYTTSLPLLNMNCVFPGAGFMYIFGVADVTNQGGTSCNPYQTFVVVLFFKSKYLPLLWTLSILTLILLFMLKQQHFTLTKVKKVKSYFTTPLNKFFFPSY